MTLPWSPTTHARLPLKSPTARPSGVQGGGDLPRYNVRPCLENGRPRHLRATNRLHNLRNGRVPDQRPVFAKAKRLD